MITNPSVEERMRNLIDILNNARHKYYAGEDEETALTDKQYNAYLYELGVLEKATGIKLPGSPTELVGFDEPEAKVAHYEPVLSLKDTKDIDELLRFLNGEDGVLSWKLDGISIILHYENGELVLALSRGNGHLGKDITKNVMMINNVPKDLPVKGKLIIRGEGVLSLKDFDLLKQSEEGEHYKNPRNLAAGLINRTKTTSLLLKSLMFIPYSIILHEELGGRIRTRHKDLEFLEELGFIVVPYSLVRNYDLKEEIDKYTRDVENFDYPVDGLVLAIDNVKLGEKRGTTSKWPKHSMAFKWPDTSVLTRVTGIEWSVKKETGYITPILIVEPVELEGTTVKRANLHNVKVFKDLALGTGDTVSIYKANKIIPVVEENLTRSGTLTYPIFCPACGKPTYLTATDKTEKLYCWHCVNDPKAPF